MLYFICKIMKSLPAAILFLFACATAPAQTTNQFLTLDNAIPLPGVAGQIKHMAIDEIGRAHV